MTREHRMILPPLCSALDSAFADLAWRHSEQAGASPDIVKLAAYTAGWVSRETGDGHSCAGIEEIAGDFAETTGTVIDAEHWRTALLGSGIASDGDMPLPLIVDDAGRVYLQRLFCAEARIAQCVLERCEQPGRATDPSKLASTFSALFPEAQNDDGDLQAMAAGLAATRRLAVIAGGPGTGKTSVVARILGLLAVAEPSVRIALAAPTGKAANRLSESIASQLETLPLGQTAKAAVAVEATTLHRLLRYNPRRGNYSRNARSRLTADIVVVDEASMVDLALFDALFAALAPSALLILLGDPNQLESVGAGYVFGDLCAARTSGRGRTSGFVADYRALGGKIEDSAPEATALDDCVIELQRSYRFAEGTPFERIAKAVRNGDADSFFAGFSDSAEATIVEPPASAEGVVALASDSIEEYGSAPNLTEAFRALSRFRILCALREGPLGAGAINAAVSRKLGLAAHSPLSVWHHGRALLVTENDYSARLFNGDVGICWTRNGRTNAHFLEAKGQIRELAASKLVRCESAWAMTVHKSQGSEFEQVVLVLPNATSPILSRELLYTGITRAKSRLTIVAEDATLRRALSLNATRASGLRDRILHGGALTADTC